MAEIISTASSGIRAYSRLIRLIEGVKAITITADATLGLRSPNILRINASTADRNVTFRSNCEPSGQCAGPYLVHNSGSTYTVTLRSSTPTTIATLLPGQWAIVYWDGLAWYSTALTAPALAAFLASNNDFTGRLTTTDGVASGTARVIGGRATSSTASSTTIAGGSGAQSYDVTYAIPASTLKAGSVLRIRGQARALAQNGTDTFEVKVRVGGTVIATSASVDIAADDRCTFDLWLNARAAPGAAVACPHGGSISWTTAGSGPTVVGSIANLATNGALTVDVQVTYGSSNAGNTSALELLIVEII